MKIMCIGQSAYDITLPLDHFPEENKKVRVSGKVACGGGSASNCAYLLAKWGINTYFAGVVGNDYYGNKIKDEYKEVGVNMKYLETDDAISTTSSYILANTSIGSRTILTSRDKNIKLKMLNDIDEDFDILLFDGYEKEFCLEAIKRNPRAIKVLDAGSMKEATVELAHLSDYVVCSHDFAEEFAGIKIDYQNVETIVKCYNKLKEEFKNNIIITLEDRGCFTYLDGFRIIPSIKVVSVDSTGAGDIFHGAFVYCLARGFDLKRTLLFSNITGALSVEKIGSRLSIPPLESVIEKYNDVVSK